MALSGEGAERAAQAFASMLLGGSIEISDGDAVARATFDEPPVARDGTVVCAATFASAEANFEWALRRVLDATGIVIDEEAQDLGRKAEGGVWTCEAVIDFAAMPVAGKAT